MKDPNILWCGGSCWFLLNLYAVGVQRTRLV